MNELLCAYCLIEQGKKTPAAILMDGTTICENHAPEIAEQAEAAEQDRQRRIDEVVERAQARWPRPGS